MNKAHPVLLTLEVNFWQPMNAKLGVKIKARAVNLSTSKIHEICGENIRTVANTLISIVNIQKIKLFIRKNLLR